MFGYILVDVNRLCHRADETLVKCSDCENQARFCERRISDPVQSRSSTGRSLSRTSIRIPASRAIAFHAARLTFAMERGPVNG